MMSYTRSASRTVKLMMSMAGPRHFTSFAGLSSENMLNGGYILLTLGKLAFATGEFQIRSLAAFTRMPVRYKSTVTVKEVPDDEKTVKEGEEKKDAFGSGGEKGISSYWGVAPRKLLKADGTE